ncbi:MAG: hypothetical protein IJI54_11185 [Kiritimatiellae bacterium]|nr:hypothetical protein [Kiritimatiellia bacterium]
MRRALLFAALLACAGAQAMPLGLRTAMWGVARARCSASGGEDDPIPALGADASPEAVAAALNGSRDGGLSANITNVAMYTAYRAWVQCVTNGTSTSAWTVKRSSSAWLSFALGADRLVPDVLAPGDIRINSLVPTAEGGRFGLEVSIANVMIGGGVQLTDANRDMVMGNLQKVLEIEGSPTLEESAFSSRNVETTFVSPVDGKAGFVVKPLDSAEPRFFLRVKVK